MELTSKAPVATR